MSHIRKFRTGTFYSRLFLLMTLLVGSAAAAFAAHTVTVKDFKINNFTFDGTLRLGLVWNNAKWFAGASAIYHTYHYHQDKLRADNIFGQLNVYVGYNFWRKK